MSDLGDLDGPLWEKKFQNFFLHFWNLHASIRVILQKKIFEKFWRQNLPRACPGHARKTRFGPYLDKKNYIFTCGFRELLDNDEYYILTHFQKNR